MEECQLGYVENALNIPIDILKEKIEPLRNVNKSICIVRMDLDLC